LTYAEAINRFGSDKPDMRFGLEIKDFTEALRNSQARVFRFGDQGRRSRKGHAHSQRG
jgi:aspartyl-tRNA synthetase